MFGTMQYKLTSEPLFLFVGSEKLATSLKRVLSCSFLSSQGNECFVSGTLYEQRKVL